MSRKVKSIPIEGRGEVTVKEVTPWAVYTAFNSEDKKAEIVTLLADAIDRPWDEIKTWYPSEQEVLLDGFMEVNKSFLSMASKLKVEKLLGTIVTQTLNDLPDVFASLFKQAMEKQRGATAGASS